MCIQRCGTDLDDVPWAWGDCLRMCGDTIGHLLGGGIHPGTSSWCHGGGFHLGGSEKEHNVNAPGNITQRTIITTWWLIVIIFTMEQFL